MISLNRDIVDFRANAAKSSTEVTFSSASKISFKTRKAGPDYPQVIGSNHRWTILDGTLGRKTWLLLLRGMQQLCFMHILNMIFFEIRDI